LGGVRRALVGTPPDLPEEALTPEELEVEVDSSQFTENVVSCPVPGFHVGGILNLLLDSLVEQQLLRFGQRLAGDFFRHLVPKFLKDADFLTG
jgi:hypothetical protein